MRLPESKSVGVEVDVLSAEQMERIRKYQVNLASVCTHTTQIKEEGHVIELAKADRIKALFKFDKKIQYFKGMN